MFNQQQLQAISEWIPSLTKGAGITISVAVISFFIALALGIIFALMRVSKNKAASYVSLLYTSIIRGIPELVLLMLVFYGGQDGINKIVSLLYSKKLISFDYYDVSPFLAGSMTIGFIYGAYMAETIRGAIIAIPFGQKEAALAFGLNEKRIFMRITFPQMLRFALPGIGNNWLVILKTTALVSLISIQDLTRIAQGAANATRQQFTFYIIAGLFFLAFTAISSYLLKILENKYSTGFNTELL